MSCFPGRQFVRVGLLSLIALCGAISARGDGPTGFTVDPTAREQARVLYNSVYQASENVASGWTGNVSQGVAGTTSDAFKDAIRLRINYFRAMAGVPSTVAFSDTFSAADQQAALMMSANGALNHTPPTNWIDYTAAGADAAGKSNLALGTSNDGPYAIDGYIADNGANNTVAGHRRWILYPPETTMGTGDVDGTDTNFGANALWVIDQASFANPAPAPRDGFVAWPPPGYVPYTLRSPRWSFSFPGADFGAATVSMTRQGAAVPVRLETLGNGAGDNTLVWVPDNEDPTNPPTRTAPAAGKEVTTTVTVANVLVSGAARSFTYTVTPFDPTVTGPDTVYPVISGPSAPVVGAVNTYAFNAVPGATGYRWQASGSAPLALDLGAENGPGDVTITPSGTSLVTTDAHYDGNACYQFTSQPPETMTLNAAFVPQAGAKLAFQSSLGYASTDDIARAQISTDGGVTWTDLYALHGAGTGGPTEDGFGAHSLDLGAYAGKMCRVRFQYAYDGSGVYFPRADQVGWFVDDITITGAQAVAAAPVTGTLGADALSFNFQPGAAGNYALQVEPMFFGQYTADAGPVLMVTAGGKGGGTGTGTGPAVTVSATVPEAHTGTGSSGMFTLTRAGSDLSQKIVVSYLLKGSAVNGTDYATLGGKTKIKANKASATVMVVPQSGGTGKVKLVVQPGSGYSVGTPSGASVKIKP